MKLKTNKKFEKLFFSILFIVFSMVGIVFYFISNTYFIRTVQDVLHLLFGLGMVTFVLYFSLKHDDKKN